jgi:hypothetical protein
MRRIAMRGERTGTIVGTFAGCTAVIPGMVITPAS